MKRESTPFAQLEVTCPTKHIWAKFYWSVNSGVYGHQVITEANDGESYFTEKTGGCGFCKKSSALGSFINRVLKKQDKNSKYESFGGDLDYFLHGTECHTGGNNFIVPLNMLAGIKNIPQKSKN